MSAVIPTFNRADTLRRALLSATGQSRPPSEIIVVDDGSTDGTGSLVSAMGAIDVRYIRQDHAGAAAARNRGVRAAAHPWIAFLDSDDYWARDHLERMTAAITATGGLARLYFTDTERPSEDGGVRHWMAAAFGIQHPYRMLADATPWVMLPLQPMMLQSAVLKRSAYLDAGGMDESLVIRHDTHLLFKLCLGGPACAVAGCGATMTSGNATVAKRLTALDGAEGLRDYWRDTVTLYRDVTSGRFPLTGAERRLLRRHLAVGHLVLGRLMWQDGRRKACVAGIWNAARASPRQFLRSTGETLGRVARVWGHRTPPRSIRHEG